MIRTALLLVLTLTGCAASGHAPTFPMARRPASWQQLCEQASSVPHANALVASRGAEGWELVAMYNGVLCYKRPAPEVCEVHLPPATPTTPSPPFAPTPPDPGF